MKFTCIREQLRRSILLVEKSTARKITLPILGSILFSAEKGKITLTTTNLEIGTETWLSGKVLEEGKIALPARIVGAYISGLSDEHITFTSQEENIIITTASTKTLIKGYPIDDFPLLPKVKKDEEFRLPAQEVRRGLIKTVLAAATSDIKPELSSILCKFSKNALKITATDSFRLAEYTISGLFITVKNLPYILIPIRTAIERIRLLEIETGEIEVVATSGQIMIHGDRFTLISRLTEGAFPDYERIVPQKFAAEVVVEKELLVSTLRAISLFSSKLNDVSLALHVVGMSMKLKTANVDVGEYSADIPIQISGEDLEISFNHRYLFDCIQQIEGKSVFLGFSSATGPVLIKEHNGAGYFYLAMPMKV